MADLPCVPQSKPFVCELCLVEFMDSGLCTWVYAFCEVAAVAYEFCIYFHEYFRRSLDNITCNDFAALIEHLIEQD